MSSSIFRICANHRLARRRSRTGTSPLTSGSDLRALDEYVGETYDRFDHENERTPSKPSLRFKPANFGRFINIRWQRCNAVPRAACRGLPSATTLGAFLPDGHQISAQSPFRVKMRNTHPEEMSSAWPPNSDNARRRRTWHLCHLDMDGRAASKKKSVASKFTSGVFEFHGIGCTGHSCNKSIGLGAFRMKGCNGSALPS